MESGGQLGVASPQEWCGRWDTEGWKGEWLSEDCREVVAV